MKERERGRYTAYLDILYKLHQLLHVGLETLNLLQLREDVLVSWQTVLLSVIELCECGEGGVLPGRVLLCHVDDTIVWSGHTPRGLLWDQQEGRALIRNRVWG